MKTHPYRIAALIAAASVGWTSLAFADDFHHDAWSHDRTGYWDDHGAHHAFIFHDHHQGYWRERADGTRIFINID